MLATLTEPGMEGFSTLWKETVSCIYPFTLTYAYYLALNHPVYLAQIGMLRAGPKAPLGTELHKSVYTSTYAP